MIRFAINKRVVSARFQQLGCLIAIAGIIIWGACLPWWEIWVGYILLLGTALAFTITALVIAIGSINDNIREN